MGTGIVESQRRARRPLRSLAWIAVLMMVASIGAPLASVRAQGDETDVPSSVEGNTYISPDFGFSITWGRDWEVAGEEVTENPTENILTLTNGLSQVIVGGSMEEYTAEDCVQELAASIENGEGVSDFEVLEENFDDEPANGTYGFTIEREDGARVNLNIYFQCESILDDDAVLYVMHFAGQSIWEDEVEERETLLEGLVAEGDPVEAPVEDDEPTDDSAGADQVSEMEGDGDLPDNADELVDLIDASITDLNAFWSRAYPELSGGEAFEPTRRWVTWTGEVDTACGPAESFGPNYEPGFGPFYCSLDKTIYMDLNFANLQLDTVPNKFVIPVVMAHEIGHHVQWELGIPRCVETPCLDPNEATSQEIEYMADCFGGAWAGDAEIRGRLGSLDIDANITQYALILGGGAESADLGGHGRGSERVWWFLNGYLEGADRCLDASPVTENWIEEQNGGTTEDDSSDDDEDAEDEDTSGLLGTDANLLSGDTSGRFPLAMTDLQLALQAFRQE